MKKIISITVILIFVLPLFASATTLLSDCALQSPGSSASDWSAIALLVSDENFDKDIYLSNLKQYVADKYHEKGLLSPTKATEWHRIALAAGLAGEDATDFGGINLINDGIFYRDNLGRQGINAYIWALITIASGNYVEPADALNKTDDIISAILSKQNEDGSFSLKAGTPDCDITAMAVCALSAYKSRAEVMTAINNALSYLSSVQNADGSFSSNGVPNAETTAQVIIAVSALGYDVKTDPRFPNLLDALSSFRTEDGYSHTYAGTTDVIATYQAKCASVAAEKKSFIYTCINKHREDSSEKEIPTEKCELVSLAPSFKTQTDTVVEESTSLIQATEVATLIREESTTEASTSIPSVENQQNSGLFYVFITFLIVIILICGIIIRRIR